MLTHRVRRQLDVPVTRPLGRSDRDVRGLSLESHEANRLADVAAHFHFEMAGKHLHRFTSLAGHLEPFAPAPATGDHHGGKCAVPMPARGATTREEHPAGGDRHCGNEKHDAHGHHHERIILNETRHVALRPVKFGTGTFCVPGDRP